MQLTEQMVINHLGQPVKREGGELLFQCPECAKIGNDKSKNNLKYNVMKTNSINYRIIGTSIIGNCKTIKECRMEILNSFGRAKFEWWSQNGKRSGNASAK